MKPDETQLETIIEITDELIAQGNAVEAAFWLGYRHGVKHYLGGIANVRPSEEHSRFIEIVSQGHRDRFIDAYARGYLNGIDGRSPREIRDEREPLLGRKRIKEELWKHFLSPCQGES